MNTLLMEKDMALRNDYDFDMLVNAMETIVIDELDRLLLLEEYSDICRCQDCILDIVAYSLNHLKPSYRSSLSYKGVMYKHQLSPKNAEGVERIIRDAIKRVTSNPSH